MKTTLPVTCRKGCRINKCLCKSEKEAMDGEKIPTACLSDQKLKSCIHEALHKVTRKRQTLGNTKARKSARTRSSKTREIYVAGLLYFMEFLFCLCSILLRRGAGRGGALCLALFQSGAQLAISEHQRPSGSPCSKLGLQEHWPRPGCCCLGFVRQHCPTELCLAGSSYSPVSGSCLAGMVDGPHLT